MTVIEGKAHVHVLRVVPVERLQMPGDQNAPAGLRLTIEAVDLERGVTLPDVEPGAGHRAHHDVVAVHALRDLTRRSRG